MLQLEHESKEGDGMSGENYTEKVSVNTSTLSQIDLLVDNGYYSNRSDFINQALREGLHNHQNTLDRIIGEQGGDPAQRRSNPHQWFVGVCRFDRRALAEIQASGQKGSITGYGVLVIDESMDEAELYEAVERIQIKGKIIAKDAVKQHYGLK